MEAMSRSAGRWATTLFRGAERLAFEVDDPEAIGGDEDLAQVIVAVGADDLRCGRQGVEDGEGFSDPWREVAERFARLARRDVESRLEVLVGRPGPRPDLVPGRLARRHLRQSVSVGEGRMQPGRQRADISGQLGGEFQADLPRGQQPARERLRRPTRRRPPRRR